MKARDTRGGRERCNPDYHILRTRFLFPVLENTCGGRRASRPRIAAVNRSLARDLVSIVMDR